MSSLQPTTKGLVYNPFPPQSCKKNRLLPSLLIYELEKSAIVVRHQNLPNLPAEGVVTSQHLGFPQTTHAIIHFLAADTEFLRDFSISGRRHHLGHHHHRLDLKTSNLLGLNLKLSTET